MKLFSQKKGRSAIAEEQDGALSGKAQFVRQVSHDIKGDFFGVSSVCVLLRMTLEKKEDPLALLQHLTEACNDYKYKLNNFLEYAKFDAGITDTLPEAVDIRQLLTTLVDEMGSQAAEKAIRIELTIPEGLPRFIRGDEFRIKHILENLLMNAMQFSPMGSYVLVNIERKGDDWSMMVKDNGEGMTDEQTDSLFILSPRERSSLRNPTGLGLIVTRYLVEDVLRGKLTITSRPRVGTQVSVRLPFVEAEA
jgi:signal transduction histidine kinase